MQSMIANTQEAVDRHTRVWTELFGEGEALRITSHGAGPVLLMLHGLGSSSFSWRHLVPVLARDYRVITLDLKGFGQSKKPRDGRYSLMNQAELVAQIIERRDLRDVTIFGSSMGGGVALSLAIGGFSAVRARLRAMVLLGSIAYAQKLPFYLGLIHRKIIGARALGLVPPQTLIRKVLSFGFHNPDRIEQEAVATYAQALTTADGREALVAATCQMIPDDVEKLTALYEDIAIPVLIISGASDRVVPAQISERLHRAIAGSKLVLLENCGHLPHEECPGAVLTAVKTFLTQLEVQ